MNSQTNAPANTPPNVPGQSTPSESDLKLLNDIVPVSRETLAKMQIYVELLILWQKKTNLVSNSTIPEIWRRHICDSAQCYALMSDKIRWLDFGSGAGFPGLVIAILGRNTDGFKISLVESNYKKCAFLREVVHQTGLSSDAAVSKSTTSNVEIIPNRIESVTEQIADIEVVTARAVTSLSKLLDLSRSWLETGAIGLFPKGREYMGEIAESHRLRKFDLIEHPSRIEKDSVLLEISNLRSV